jgi:hypothetical protein
MSAVASQSINDVFSATYDHYRIIISGKTDTTTGNTLQMRMRVSATDNSSSNYRFTRISLVDNSASPAVSSNASNGLTTFFTVGILSSTTGFTSSTFLDIANPFSSENASFSSLTASYNQDAPYGFYAWYSGVLSVATSYTGFTIYSSGDITGTISVYGYKK